MSTACGRGPVKMRLLIKMSKPLGRLAEIPRRSGPVEVHCHDVPVFRAVQPGNSPIEPKVWFGAGLARFGAAARGPRSVLRFVAIQSGIGRSLSRVVGAV